MSKQAVGFVGSENKDSSINIAHEYAKLVIDHENLERQYKELQEKYELLKRRNTGLETQVANFRRKQEAMYNDLGWSK